MMKAIATIMIVALITSCNLKTETTHTKTYFDLKGYFEKEADRLSKANQQLQKSVAINNEKETKKLVIKDWRRELNAFISADINKDSWKGAFQVSGNAEEKIYTTNDVKIPVKKVIINEKQGKLKSVQVYISAANNLYSSQDTLTYYPDSLYCIKKAQKIKLLDRKTYEIIGRFTN